MKYFLKCSLILLLCSSFFSVQAQIHSCCIKPSSMVAFADFASDPAFRAMHASPLPANYAPLGRMITFQTPDGKSGQAYFIPAKKETKNYLFVLQEWWGLNDWIKKQSDELAAALNVNVIALDLYDGKLATNSDEAEKLMQANDPARSKSIIQGALNHAGSDARVATIGWCFGGGWSLQTALMAGKQAVGCVMYYGMPETDVNKLKSLNSDVLFIFAKKDGWINEAVKNDFIKNMEAAGKKLTVKEYDAVHAFANPSNPDHDKEVAADAMQHSVAFLEKSFGK